MIVMNHGNNKLLKQIGILVLIALTFTILPRFVFASLAFIIRMAVWVGFIYILYRLFGKKYLSNYMLARKFKKKKPQSHYSDRR